MNFLEKLGDQAPVLFLMYFLYMYAIFQNKFALTIFILIVINSSINVYSKYLLMNLMKSKNHKLPILGNFCRPLDRDCKNIDPSKFYTAGNYGMPSGHSQTVSFITSFYYFYNKDYATFSYPTFYTFLIISLFVMVSRYTSSMHTIQQISVGSLYGTLIGYISAKIVLYFIPK